MRLTKKQRTQMRLLTFGLLLLSWSAYELWHDIQNSYNFNEVNMFLEEEVVLDENAKNFKNAIERNQLSIVQTMFEGRLVEKNSNVKIKDFNYMGESLLKKLKENQNSELKPLRDDFLKAWSEKGEQLLKKEYDILSLSKIDCQYSLYCRYKKNLFEKEIENRTNKKDESSDVKVLVKKLENLK